jgi:hypothetical protein
MKRIGIIGTRRRNTAIVRKLIEVEFWKIYEEGDIICSGGCSSGGDRFAEQIAKAEGIPILTIYPKYKKYGLGAPVKRDPIIAENSDILIACVVDPEHDLDDILKRKKGGTEHTLRAFVEQGKSKRNIIIV